MNIIHPRAYLSALSVVCLLFINLPGLAENVASINRYMSVDLNVKPGQMNLLTQTVQTHFAPQVETVGEALTLLLHSSGYDLIAQSERCLALQHTLTKPLPAIDRTLGPLTLRDALMVLVGPAFSLVDDPLNRTVNFIVKPDYAVRFGRTKIHSVVEPTL